MNHLLINEETEQIAEPQTHHPKILIVDDRPENLFSLRAILEEDDFDIIEANCGETALQMAREHHFALIISDVQMPEMNGFQLLEALRSQTATMLVPVIFVTAISKEEKYIHKGYSEGAVDYLFKPLDPFVVKAKTDVFISLYRQQALLKSQKHSLALLNKRLTDINGELEQFSYVAAHDLKSPLGNIISMCNGFKAVHSEKLDQGGKEIINHIHISAKRLCDLIAGILSYHKGDHEITNAKERIDFSAICSEVADMFRYSKDVEIFCPKGPLHLYLNEVAMKQILINLVSNAVRYNDKEKILVNIKFVQEDDLYRFSVQDNGPGVEKKDQQKIFELFTTLHKKDGEGNEGAGIGLATIKKLIEKQDGSIAVESLPGKGFTLSFILPSY
jgi:two-component system, sensor histidine kinase and response regulator